MISPTACGALFSARNTPQPWQPRGTRVWNPSGTLVEPLWNLTSGPPRTTPEPIWAKTPKLSAVGGKSTPRIRFGLRQPSINLHLGAGAVFHGSHLQRPIQAHSRRFSSSPSVAQSKIFGFSRVIISCLLKGSGRDRPHPTRPTSKPLGGNIMPQRRPLSARLA